MPFIHQTARLAVAALVSIVAVGCSVDRPAEIPAGAKEVTAGDNILSYRAPSDGKVWIIDSDDEGKVVYSGAIDRGDEIRVDTDKNRVTLDGDTVFEKGLRRGNQHRIFFDPDGSPEKRIVVEERTVIEREVK